MSQLMAWQRRDAQLPDNYDGLTYQRMQDAVSPCNTHANISSSSKLCGWLGSGVTPSPNILRKQTPKRATSHPH